MLFLYALVVAAFGWWLWEKTKDVICTDWDFVQLLLIVFAVAAVWPVALLILGLRWAFQKARAQ